MSYTKKLLTGTALGALLALIADGASAVRSVAVDRACFRRRHDRRRCSTERQLGRRNWRHMVSTTGVCRKSIMFLGLSGRYVFSAVETD